MAEERGQSAACGVGFGLPLPLSSSLAAPGGIKIRKVRANTVTYETVRPARTNLTVNVTATGTIQPTTQTDISSEMSGVVRSVNVDNNDLIKKGDVLAELDLERYQAQLRSLEASVASAKAKLTDAQATLQASDLALARQVALQKRGLVDHAGS